MAGTRGAAGRGAGAGARGCGGGAAGQAAKRAAGKGAGGEEREEKSNRGVHTEAQRAVLEAAFARESQPNEQQKKALGEQTGLTQRQVRNWFQNRRQRNRGRAETRHAAILKAHNTKLVREVGRVREVNETLTVENRLLRSECRKAHAHLQDLQEAAERLLPAYYDAKISAREVKHKASSQAKKKARKRERSPQEASPAPPATRGGPKRARRAAG